MPIPTTVLALSGSLQRVSSNAALLRVASGLVPDGAVLDVFPSLGDLPHLNPDLDGDGAPAPVRALRARVARADAVLIASPEYGHGMPGFVRTPSTGSWVRESSPASPSPS